MYTLYRRLRVVLYWIQNEHPHNLFYDATGKLSKSLSLLIVVALWSKHKLTIQLKDSESLARGLKLKLPTVVLVLPLLFFSQAPSRQGKIK